MNSNLYYYRSSSVWDWQKNGKEWPQWLLYMHFCHIESNHALPQYAQTGEILTYMSYDEVRQWSGTSIGHRGEDYEEFKRKKAEAVIKALEEEVPGINDQIEQYYVSTPLTYQDYTGTLEGSIYGVARDVQTLVTGTVNCRTSIPNLLLTGQSTACHGMLGVLASSLVTCSEVIGMDTLLRQLK
jgi:all-trans-retinol 13,14-reductase